MSDEHAARRAEFDAACQEYGAECASALKLALLDERGRDFEAAKVAKARAQQRVFLAWQMMCANKDPETR